VKRTSKGFIHLIPLLAVALILIVGTGYFVYKNGQITNNKTTPPSPFSNQKTTNGLGSDIDHREFCNSSSTDSETCPSEFCTVNCVGGGDLFGCVLGCVPKDCQDFSAEDCPLISCKIMTNSAGEKVCYYRPVVSPPACGGHGYYGQEVECCPGLVLRSGKVLKNETCATKEDFYRDAFPYCLNCGNEICDTLENKCNCPEDCN